MKSLFALPFVFFLSSCNNNYTTSDNGSRTRTRKETGAGTGAGPSTTVLEGTWNSGCYVSENQPQKVSRTFSGTSLTQSITFYNDANCTAARAYWSNRHTIEITLGGAATTPSDATKIDYKFVRRHSTPKSAEAVKDANGRSYFGKTNWELNVEQDITGKKDDGSTFIETPILDIFKITGSTVCFGHSASGDGSSEAKRPTKLEADAECLTKQ